MSDPTDQEPDPQLLTDYLISDLETRRERRCDLVWALKYQESLASWRDTLMGHPERWERSIERAIAEADSAADELSPVLLGRDNDRARAYHQQLEAAAKHVKEFKK